LLLSFERLKCDFLDYIRSEKGLSSHTVEAYGRDIASFGEYLGFKDPKEVLSNDILGFLGFLKTKQYASSSICRALVSVKVFFRFLKKEGEISQDLGEFFDTPRMWQLIPEVLSIEEIDALLKQPNPEDKQGARDKAILELMYATGMRVSELCLLRINDLSDTFVKVWGKGKKERIIPVGKRAIAAVDHYLLSFRGEVKEENGPLFVSLRGKPIDRITIWNRIKVYAKSAGYRRCLHRRSLF